MRPPKKPSKKRSLYLPKFATGIALLGSSLLWFMALIGFGLHQNPLGLIGQILAAVSFFLFGIAAFLSPIYMAVCALCLIKEKFMFIRYNLLFFLFFLLSTAQLLAQLGESYPSLTTLFEPYILSNENGSYLGGIPLHYFYVGWGPFGLKELLGSNGTTLVFSLISFISAIALIPQLPTYLKSLFKWFWRQKSKEEPIACEEPECLLSEKKELFEKEYFESSPEKDLPLQLIFPEKAVSKKHIPLKVSNSNYEFPSHELIDATPIEDNSASLKNDLRHLAKRLEETLSSFAIEVKVGNIIIGPRITSFEVHPAVGVKVQKILALENDIALNLQAKSIRIVAPIPGKAAVGIEVPNQKAQAVGFRELLEAYQSSGRRLEIPLLLGRGISGDEIMADMTKMPHMIIAGATGSGKSVCINVIVISILMNCSPEDVKLLIVDPKKVELGGYSALPHMIAPVITEAEEAFLALHWLVKEMERRYSLLRDQGFRHIQAYREASDKNPDLEKMPYIVVIIDELADLMMMANSDIETPIIRLAQMARAIGIHLILATQRPSREVITGLIKANFPTRIAFKVSSRINSQIILDDNGAESLLGSGDMLFLAPGQSLSLRAQGAYLSDHNINRVVEAITKKQGPNWLISSFETLRDQLQEKSTGESIGDDDPLLAEAKSLIFETGTASTTFLQRKLKIGYARAASLMDALENAGIVGPQEGAKPRKIYFSGNRRDFS